MKKVSVVSVMFFVHSCSNMQLACLRYWHVPVATVLMATQPLLTESNLNADGAYDFIMVGVTLLAEFIKLFVSAVCYFTVPTQGQSHGVMRICEMIEFAIPALVYFVNNNLVFFILANITSTQFQILSCLKTVFTALLFRVFLCKLLSTAKWMAIVTLACGAAVSQLSTTLTDAVGYDEEVLIGSLATIASCLLSSFAGVYNEVLLKRNGQVHSIHLQNSLLYAWGVCFNCIGLLILYHNELTERAFFKGYTPLTWTLVLNNAFSGLAISAVLKFANNIVRIFAHAGAMTITAILGSAMFGHHVTSQLILSMILVTASTVSYASDGPMPSTKPETSRTLISMDRTLEARECELETRSGASLTRD